MTALPVPPHAGLQVLLAGADGGGRGGLCRRVWVVVRHHLAEPCWPPQPRPTVTRPSTRVCTAATLTCIPDEPPRRALCARVVPFVPASCPSCVRVVPFVPASRPSCPRRALRARVVPVSLPAASARRPRLLYTKGAGSITPRSAWPPFLRWPGRCTAASPRRTGPPSAGRRGVRGRQRPASGSPARGSGAPP